jgi:hypothetical protein
MTASPPHQTALSLAQMTLDEHTWPRDALDDERVELFAEMIRDARESAGTGQGWTDPLPPLVVVADGQGGHVLADGRHRYEARRRLGAEFHLVQAQVFQADGRPPIDRAYELALGFATISAKPLTRGEKQTAIRRLITERPDLSDRQIGRLVGVAHTTVGRTRSGGASHQSGGPGDGTGPAQSSSRSEPLRWRVAARRLAEDVAELLSSCRKLFGGADFKSAGRELYDALADLYGDEDALEVIEELSAVVSSARARAERVAQV